MSRHFELLHQSQLQSALVPQDRVRDAVSVRDPDRDSAPSLRTLVALLFRQRRIVVLSFATVLLASVATVVLSKDQYEASTKILLEQTRQDPIVTADPTSNVTPNTSNGLSEEDINSEVGLMEGNDILQQVVISCGLDQAAKSRLGWLLSEKQDHNVQVAKAVATLKGSLRIDPLKKSNLVVISYRSRDPQLAARVLNTLSGFYLEKHAMVHRPQGAYEFFKKETDRFRADLDAANRRLLEFNQRQNVVSPEQEKAAILQGAAQFQASEDQTRSAIAETESRIRMLTTELAARPARKTTLVKTSSILLEQLQSHLFDLEQQRIDLLNKFEPSYRPVQELDREISSTRSAIAEAQEAPPKEETTDSDPTYGLLESDLAKSTADLATLEARAVATKRIVEQYGERAHDLDQSNMTEQDLLRKVKIAEDGYLAYQHKQEEARMSEALDQHQIVNVTIAEAAAVPYLPVLGRSTRLEIAFLLTLVLSIISAFLADRWDHSFRTPEEVEFNLQIPVLAAMPKDEGLEPNRLAPLYE